MTQGGQDTFSDFTLGVDMIHLEGFGFGTATSALCASAFVSSTSNATRDADNRFVFRTGDSTLW